MKYIILVSLMLMFHTALFLPITNSIASTGQTHILYIVVTFYSLLPDVEQLILPTDIVEYIAPLGVDPHTYSLTPSDIEKLSKADIIISTAHTGFELKIRELKEQGVIHGELVEIPYIKGIRIKKNPVTSKPNLHMPIYDPYNYKVFIKKLVEVIVKHNPSYRDRYWRKGNETIRLIDELIKNTPHLNATAVAETPVLQYAVEWIGIRVKYLLVKEPGVSATPRDIENIIKAIENGSINLVVVSAPVISKPGEYLLDYALKHNIPVLRVPTPTSPGSIIDKLGNVSRQVMEVSSGFRVGRGVEPPGYSFTSMENLSITLGVLVFVLSLIYLVVKRYE